MYSSLFCVKRALFGYNFVTEMEQSIVFSRVLFALLKHRDVFGQLGGWLGLPGLTAWLDGWMTAWLDA